MDLPLVQEFMPSQKRGWIGGLVTCVIPLGTGLGAVLAAARAEFGDVTLAGSGSTLFIEGHHGLGSTWLTDVGELQVCETVTA